MIEIEYVSIRRCDLCGKKMSQEHVTITWTDDSKTDVCHDCTKQLNMKLREIKRENGM